MKVYKTTNAGINWNAVNSLAIGLSDLFFVNKDTGWICDYTGFAGLFKTTNSGVNWQQQLGPSFTPKRIFMLNRDTGWVISNELSTRLLRTTNGGTNWNLHYTFTSPGAEEIFFTGKDTAWATGGSTG